MDQLKLSKIQIALYFDKTQLKDNDFFKEKMTELGFEENAGIKLPSNNLSENISHIIWQKSDLVLQVSQIRLDIINQNLENGTETYEVHIEKCLEQIGIICEIFSNQKVDINRLGFVFSYILMIKDSNVFNIILKEIQNKFITDKKRKENIQIFNLVIQEKINNFVDNTNIQCLEAEMTTNDENGLVEKKPIKLIGVAKDFVFKEEKIYEKNTILNNFKVVSELCTQEKINEILQ